MVSGAQSPGNEGLVGFVEMDEGHAHATPAALDGGEGLWLFGDEGLLLFWRELDDSETFLLRGEGCEDAIVEAEVGVVHVGAFRGPRKLECEATEEFDTRIHMAVDSTVRRLGMASLAADFSFVCLEGISDAEREDRKEGGIAEAVVVARNEGIEIRLESGILIGRIAADRWWIVGIARAPAEVNGQLWLSYVVETCLYRKAEVGLCAWNHVAESEGEAG